MRKELGMEPALLGGSCERGKVLAPWEVPWWGDQLKQRGRFGALENAAAGFAPAGAERDLHSLCHHSARTARKHVSTSVGGAW